MQNEKPASYGTQNRGMVDFASSPTPTHSHNVSSACKIRYIKSVSTGALRKITRNDEFTEGTSQSLIRFAQDRSHF